MFEEKLDIGSVIGRTFSAIGANVIPFTVASLLLVGLPAFLIEWIVTHQNRVVEGMASASLYYWLISGLGFILAVLFGYLLQAFVVRVSILHIRGRDAPIGEGLVAILLLMPKLIGVAILSTIVVLFGFLLLIVPGVIFYIMLIIAVPVLVVEGVGVTDSMSRSRQLTSGSRWRIFLLVLLFALLSAIVSGVLSGLLGAAAGALGIFPQDFPLAAESLGQAIGSVVSAAGVSALYIELRTLKEGTDSEQLADIFS